MSEQLHPNYSLTQSKEEKFDDDNYINPLPRSVIRPNSFILLDGNWKFEVDRDNRGITDNWNIAHEYKDTAHWPGSVEAHMSEEKEATWMDQIVVWYERNFPLPQVNPGDNTTKSQLQLTFGACGYETMVWLNGHLLKTIEGEEVHIGEYTSFSYELEYNMLQADNKLTVRIAGTMDADTTRGKQESSVYKRGGIWYQTYTGAVRSIWLETVERNRLRSRVDVVSSAEDNLVRFNITTRIHDPGQYTVKLKVYHRNPASDEPVATDEYPLILEAGQKKQRLVLELPESKLWSPADPHLYRLVAQLADKDGYEAEIETHFGLRKIEAHGQFIYLNNSPIYLDGILYQPGIADYELIKKHMYAMRALGCNLVRIHIAGVDPRIYNLADKMGMLLWVEVPSPHRSTAKSRENHRAELLRLLALVATHPSVIIWSLYNEDWGIQDIATSADTRQYIIDTYNYLQINYPQFLVVDNDGWQHISFEGRLKSDMLTAHLYTPDLPRWQEMLDGLALGHQFGVTAFPLTIGDPYFYRKQVPLLVSEWGGFGFANYGGPTEGQDRTPKIIQFKEELRKRPIAGDVYTQATNIEEERNGLIDFNSGELTVPAGILKSKP